jgi:NAD(P)-dependent dehydrogenase (short-subunit alcohol dehydrogenase family)
MTKLFDLQGRVAIVTGGYGHLGRAMVRVLLDFNAQVIVAGRSEEKFLRVFSKEERSILSFRKTDITDGQNINEFFGSVLKEFGRVDILINNATSSRGHSQETMSDEDWTYTFEGVVGSVHKCIKAVIPAMKQQKSGKIINISSMYGMISPDFNSLYEGNDCEQYTNPPHYGAAKAAMNQLTRYFAVLLAPCNIQVNAIAPGPFPNTAIQEKNPLFIERLKKKNPLNKIGKPEDLSGIVTLLSSSASDFITGQVIQVDGGWTIW